MHANHRPAPIAIAAALVSLLGLALVFAPAGAAAPGAVATPASADADGQRGFDFEFGRWDTRIKRLRKPLSGSSDWVEYRGTTVVRPVQNGRANLAELDVAGAAGRIEGVSLRLYDPQTRRWSLHYANLGDGALTAPMVGRFEQGRGEFYADDRLGDRPIRVRFVIRCETADRCTFEQAYSADAGKTWETNWIATDTRVADASAPG